MIILNNRIHKALTDPVRTAMFSDDLRHRFYLDIIWDQSIPPLVCIGLNPSTADHNKDDPTLRKVQGFARRWGKGGVRMLNVYTYRSTDPRGLKQVEDPVVEVIGWDLAREVNAHYIEAPLRQTCKAYNGQQIVVLCAWGTKGGQKAEYISECFHSMKRSGCNLLTMCLRTTKDGHPEHPLYVPYETEPKVWS